MNEIGETIGAYEVRHYPRDPERLLIVFAGAGAKGHRGRVEEFRNTVWGTGASLCFVRDLAFAWYSDESAALMFDRLGQLCSSYPHAGALGHSMGASGAILCADHCPKLERVLAFAPQFSMVEPFIRFDERFDHVGSPHAKRRRPAFHAADHAEKTVILCGDQDWPDLVHAGVYAVHGYTMGFVNNANHMIPRALKLAPEGNLLVKLAAQFADFSAPFDYAAVRGVLGDRVAPHVTTRTPKFDTDHRPRIDEAADWASRSALAAAAPQRLASPEGLRDLATGRTTDQSSISRWSRGTTAEDSARAVSRNPTGRFSFHTGEEDSPWWSIDLGGTATVRLVRIYNRMQDLESARRGVRFVIEVAEDEGWREAFRKADLGLFGGADGHPFTWAPEGGVITRRLRIRLLDRAAMHYDRIEIFG